MKEKDHRRLLTVLEVACAVTIQNAFLNFTEAQNNNNNIFQKVVLTHPKLKQSD